MEEINMTEEESRMNHLMYLAQELYVRQYDKGVHAPENASTAIDRALDFFEVLDEWVKKQKSQKESNQ